MHHPVRSGGSREKTSRPHQVQSCHFMKHIIAHVALTDVHNPVGEQESRGGGDILPPTTSAVMPHYNTYNQPHVIVKSKQYVCNPVELTKQADSTC